MAPGWRVGMGMLVGAGLLLAACTPHVEGRLTYPPPRPPPEELPGRPPEPTRPPRRRPVPPAPPREEPPAPAGIYFLHDRGAGLEDCVFVGERVTGGAPTGRRESEEARSRAVLDMAEQARWLGGNVVILPHFRESYEAGHLVGRVYRCDEARRRAIYRRAAEEQRLTVVP